MRMKQENYWADKVSCSIRDCSDFSNKIKKIWYCVDLSECLVSIIPLFFLLFFKCYQNSCRFYIAKWLSPCR